MSDELARLLAASIDRNKTTDANLALLVDAVLANPVVVLEALGAETEWESGGLAGYYVQVDVPK